MTTIKFRYIPALDGIRALAVLSVILYHLNPVWAPSGLLGVTMFFVLSGFLITSLLLVEYHNTNTIDLPAFWMRRIKRLVPAIVFVIVCTTALCTLFDHVLLTKIRTDIVPSLFFFNNWWQIFHEVSYFDALGSPSPLTHFWSLAIEEQFYLIWPPLLLILFKLKISKKTVRRGVLVGAAASALLMALLYDPSGDPSRVYYGTDTRAFSLLVGAWLAFVWPAWQLQKKKREDFPRSLQITLDTTGGLCLLAIIAIMFTIDGFSPLLYRGGILLFSLITAGLIAIIVHPASLIGKVLSTKPLNWIGLRSYGIYLWHFPIFLLLNPAGTHPNWWMAILEVTLVFAIAAFSYRFIENPIRKGTFYPFLDRFSEAKGSMLRTLKYTPLAACVLVFLLAGGGIALVPEKAAVEDVQIMQKQQEQVEAAKAAAIAKAAEEERKFDVMLIGDSVSLAALPYFQETFPYGCLDSAVSRQFVDGEFVLDTYLEQNLVGKIVILSLGSNGPVMKENLDSVLSKLGEDHRVFLMTTRSGQSWEASVNDLYYQTAQEYPWVSIIDWYGLSQMKADVFEADNIHLTAVGAEYFNSLILDAVRNDLPERSLAAIEPPATPEPQTGAEAEGEPTTEASEAETAAQPA